MNFDGYKLCTMARRGPLRCGARAVWPALACLPRGLVLYVVVAVNTVAAVAVTAWKQETDRM